MDNKLEIVEKLNEMGYKAKLYDDGLIYIDASFDLYPKVKKLLKSLGYKGSYGIRKVSD